MALSCYVMGPWHGCISQQSLRLKAVLRLVQDFIPPEELAKVLAKSGNETAKAQAAALEEQQRIQADNVGHRMLQVCGAVSLKSLTQS